MIVLSVEQIAGIYFAAGIGFSIFVAKCPKPYTWMKVKVNWLHKKLDTIEGEVPDALKDVYKAAEDAVAKADAALADDKLTASEIGGIIAAAYLAVNKARKALL